MRRKAAKPKPMPSELWVMRDENPFLEFITWDGDVLEYPAVPKGRTATRYIRADLVASPPR